MLYSKRSLSAQELRRTHLKPRPRPDAARAMASIEGPVRREGDVRYSAIKPLQENARPILT